MPRNPVRTPGTRSYQNYKPEVLEACLRAIKSKQKSQRKAAKHYNIPRSTIENKLKKQHGKGIGRQLYSVVTKKLASHSIVLYWQISASP